MLAMENSKHVYIKSSDSSSEFPDNSGSHFRVKVNDFLSFDGSWAVCMSAFNLVVKEQDIGNVLDGRDLKITCNLVYLSLVGDQRQQVLRILNLGRPIVSTSIRTVYHIDAVENCCFYKPVITRDCSYIEFFVDTKTYTLWI